MDLFKLAPHEWAGLRDLLDDALALPVAERAAWVDALDEQRFGAMKPRLRALLAEPAGPSITTLPRLGADDCASPRGVAEGAGQWVGPYRLVRELGHGGMASVWLAERQDMLQQRPVALKLPHGAWRRAGLAERLAREREILAALEHPNIARLYDAGVTAEGQPYLALEHVDGPRIDEHCRQHALPIRQRIELFLQAARAVAHAHARLVVHRDLKPSNILVGRHGEVKLLDFGIAKLLSDGAQVLHDTALTQQAGHPFTPAYAAPEQLAGQAIGTAADIYSLGVLLCELLSGQRPQPVGMAERQGLPATPGGHEPRAPSELADPSLRGALRGDLDTIVLHALKAHPGDRYPTVDAFVDDLERHLRHEPVKARPDARAYRLRKFVQRHRWGVGAASAVGLSLAIGLALALWQASVAREQQRRADGEAERARRNERLANAQSALANFLAMDLATGRSSTELQAQFERAATMVRREHANDAGVRAVLLAGIAARHRSLGQFERWRLVAGEAETAARAAGDHVLVAGLACQRGRDIAQAGRIAEGGALVAQQIATLRGITPLPQAALIGCLADASAVARQSGDAAGGLRSAEGLVAIERGAGAEHTATHADSLMILARAQAMAGRFGDALASLRHGLRLLAALDNGQTSQATNLRAIEAAMLRDGGLPLQALRAQDRLLAEHAARGGAPRTLASVHYDHALSMHRAGRSAEAATLLRPVIADAAALGDATLSRAASVALLSALAHSGALSQARAQAAELLPRYQALRDKRAYPSRLFLLALAELELASAQPGAARAAIDEAEQAMRSVANPDDPGWRQVEQLRGQLALTEHRLDDARAHAERALGHARRLSIEPGASVLVGEALLQMARIEARRGRHEAARASGAEAARHLGSAAGDAHALLPAAARLAAGETRP